LQWAVKSKVVPVLN